jgi:hypothetical protein
VYTALCMRRKCAIFIPTRAHEILLESQGEPF